MEKNFYPNDDPFVIRNDVKYRMKGGVTNMQGRLFSPDSGIDLPPSVSDDDRLHAVALSLVNSPVGSGIWRGISASMPADIFGRIAFAGGPVAGELYERVYPGAPLEAARRIMDRVAATPVHILTYWDREYPPLLREIPLPPLVLYVHGEIEAQRSIAVVGTRKADGRSATVARRIGYEMAASGYTVVSGMALGIDREAHMGALEAGGNTIGVIPSGIDITYPMSNRDLYHKIKGRQGSALVSEYPPGIEIAGKWTFVRRNRIISGLCPGTVVVKAEERSGALITARHALDQNREVFACAGNAFDVDYSGCHGLIKNGAVLVSSTRDIIDELGRYSGGPVTVVHAGAPRVAPGEHSAVDEPEPVSLAGKIVRLLSAHEHDVDAVIRATGGSPGEVNEAITALEFEGRILRNGNILSRL